MHFQSVIYVTICNIFLAICVAINLYFFLSFSGLLSLEANAF